MKLTIADDYQQYADFLNRIPTLFEQGEGTLLYKQRNEVRQMEHAGRTFVVKRYKRVNAIQQVVYTFFRKTKAERAFLYAQEFRRRGIDTPHEVAYLETGRCGLFTVGYLVTEACYWPDTALPLRETQDFDRPLARAVMQHVALMHQKGILHGDLNLTNFLYNQDAYGYHFAMIDINRSHFCDGWPTDEQCLQNMVRLTHRRDLYDFLVRSYARQREWGEDATAAKAEALLDQFENRKWRF